MIFQYNKTQGDDLIVTLILAQEFESGIVVASDMLRISIDENGKYIEDHKNEALKISILHNRIGVAIAGLGSLGDSCIKGAQSIFAGKKDVPQHEIKKCCQEYFQFAMQQFSLYRPEYSSSGMSFLIFGYETISNQPYMYYYNSSNNFTETKITPRVGFGSGIDIAKPILERLDDEHEPELIGNKFINVIRQTSEKDITVGSNVHCLILTKDSFSEMAINKDNKFIIDPKNFGFS